LLTTLIRWSSFLFRIRGKVDVSLASQPNRAWFASERSGRVDPEYGCSYFARINPAVRDLALEVEAVAFDQLVGFSFELDSQAARYHKKEFLACMRNRSPCSTAGLDIEQMRFHD